MKTLSVYRPGRIDYLKALSFQKKLHQSRLESNTPDSLILLEHPPVITTGRRNQAHNILINPEKMGVQVVETERGGEVTYHGPGQLVGYPILRVHEVTDGIRDLVWRIEESIIRMLGIHYNIKAGRHSEHRGVWIGNGKIAAIGISIKKDVSFHGFAFNINPDLSHFGWIVPCGIQNMGVTSLSVLIGREPDMDLVSEQVTDCFANVFEYKCIKYEDAYELDNA